MTKDEAVRGDIRKEQSRIRNYYTSSTKKQFLINCFPGGCIFVTLSVELDDQLPELAREVSKGFEGLKSMIHKLLEEGREGRELGELKDDTDTAAVTEMIFAGILGATVIYGVDKSSEKLTQTINALLEYLNRLAPQSAMTAVGTVTRECELY